MSKMSLSPDGLGLLFDSSCTGTEPNSSELMCHVQMKEKRSLPVAFGYFLSCLHLKQQTTAQLKPEQLPLPGFHPRWLP
jgi:hypothetical protein